MKTNAVLKKICINYQELHFMSIKTLKMLINKIKEMDDNTFFLNDPPDVWVNRKEAIANIRQELIERSWGM